MATTLSILRAVKAPRTGSGLAAKLMARWRDRHDQLTTLLLKAKPQGRPTRV